MLTICKDSHLDHGLTMDQLRWVLETFGDREGFFIETVELPEGLGTLSCALYGPTMGDEPVHEGVALEPREGRSWPSRLIDAPKRQTRTVTVIAGPHGDQSCVLYTVYGGPAAPQEENDPNLPDEKYPISRDFWKDHALAR